MDRFFEENSRWETVILFFFSVIFFYGERKVSRRWLIWLTDLGMGEEKEMQIHSSEDALPLVAQFLVESGAVSHKVV